MAWFSRADKFKVGTPDEVLGMAEAYQRVFMVNGHPTNEDKQIVMADMAHSSGFYTVLGPEVSPEARAFADGKRSVIARVHSFLQMPADMRWHLEAAARAEAHADVMAEDEASQ